MYCLEKLQRELAYYFDMDLRELPKVESLLAEAGYTQIRKGNDIIEIDSALGRYSTDLGDSSVETKELHTKTTSKLTKDELDNLPIATAQEYGEFLEKIAQKDYQNTPEILKIATLNNDLQELINNNHSASVFITRARAGHISEVRKGEYDQALTLEEQKQIPAEIAQAKQAYTDDKSGFILPFADKNNSEKINLIILDSDSKGNFLITAKKVNSAELNNPKYKKLARAGVEPATTTLPKAEQKPTEAISLARDEIIPQATQEIIKQAKQSGKSVAQKKELLQKNKEIESANNLKIQEAKEKIKQLNKESRDLAYNAPTIMYLGRGYTKSQDKKYLDYKSRLSKKLEENGIHLDFMELEKLKQDTTLKGKARKEALDTIYLRMYKNMQQAHKELKEQVATSIQKIRERNLQEAKEWLEKNKGASSDLDHEFKSKIAEIDKQLDLAFKKDTKDTEFIDLMNRKRGTLTYAKNRDLGVVRLPELEKFSRRGYPIDLKTLRDIQKEHNYTDKILSLNGRDFSKSFEVMRAEIEARIGIKPIAEFGTNYAEFYRDGKGAIQKLIKEAQAFKERGAKGEYKGQVAGAFHRDDIGDITLAWGEKGTGKSDGWGLSKIIEYHPEVLDKLDKLIQDLPIVKETENRYKLDNGDFFISIRKDFEGQKQNWVLTALERDESIARRRTDLPSSQSEAEKTTSANAADIIPQTKMPKDNSDPVKTFEYFRDDLMRGYDKALEAFEGKRPLVSTIPYKALDPIIEAKRALLKEANDDFKKILQKAGFPDDVIQEKFMKTLSFGDIDYNLPRIRQYFDEVEKNLHQYDETYKPIAEKLLKQKDEVIRFYESRLPAEQELEKKRMLLNEFMENARVYGNKEDKLLNNFIDEIEAKRALESTQTPQAPKGLFDEVDSSVSNFTYTTGEAKGIAELRKDLKQALEPYKSTPITNKETGLQGVITTDEINKIASKKAVDKSVANGFSRDEHFTAAQDLKNLFENSKLKESHADNKHRENIKVHRFIKDLHINDKPAQAKITLFEKIEGKNKIYTLELESLNKPDSLGASVHNTESAAKAQSVATAHPETTTIAKTDGESIAQDSNALLESTMQKFSYDERKAKDLLEWHKDSHPLTKDENGVPKVFYHGTEWREIGNKIFEVFDTKYSNQVDKFLQGHYFSSSKKIARTYNANNIYKVFLNAKNPLVIDFKGHTFNDYIDEAINNIPKSVQENIRDFYDSIIFKNIIDDSTQNGEKHPVADTIMVLDSNQIKHIENRGIESEQGQKYFNESSPNIFHSNPHAGAGLLGGSVAGIETDENGNITFNPEKFALGLLGGAVGSKAVASGFTYLKNNPQVKEAVARELANTLALGFDKARQKYPALNLLEPRRIIQNEKGRAAQARNMLKSAEKQSRAIQLKTRKTLKKYNIESLEIAQEQEYRDFVSNVWDKKGYEKAPNILKIAVLPQHLQAALRVKFSEVFLTKKDLSHFRTARKQHYNQALSEAEILEIPSVITHAKTAYIDTQHKNFLIVFNDKIDSTKLNFIHFNTDELGNYIITTKKADRQVLNNKQYKQVGSGIEPHIP